MATYSLSGSVSSSANKQGDYNSNGSKSFSNSTLKIDFSSSLTKFRNAVDVDAITITSATLYIACTASGKSAKKRFKINYYNTGKVQTLTSNGVAFNRTTSITLNTSNTLQWVKSGSQIRSTDPDISGSGHSSSKGGRYSENYVKVSSASITINYTINKSSFTDLSTDFYFRANNQLTWKANNSEYTHTITLKPEGATVPYTLLKQNVIPEEYNFSFIDENNKNKGIYFSLPEEIAKIHMTDKTTLKANLSIETFNKDSDPLGTETKSITLLIDPENYPYNISITEENLENLTPWPNEKHLIIIANHTKPKFSIEASSDLGAEITSCLFEFQDGQSLKGEKQEDKKEDSFNFSCEPIFTNIENTDLIVNITLTDSRGIKKDFQIFTGASLLNKSILNFSSLPDIHSHDDENCYEEVLGCQEEMHIHDESCYTDGVLICGKKEHNHDENCRVKKLICSKNYQINPITIYGYQKPEIKNFTVQRYFEQKKETENGNIYNYILDEFEGKHIKIINLEKNNTEKINEEDNSLKYFLKIQDNKSSEILTDWGSGSKEEFKQIDIEDYLPLAYNDLELSITLKISDSFNFYEKTFILDSAHYLLHFRKGEPSVGIGTAAESIPLDSNGEPMLEGLITMGWPVKMKEPLGVEYGGTGVSSYNGIIKNLIKDLLENLMPIGYLFPSVTHPKINNTLSNDFINFLRETYWISVEKHENYTMWKRTNPKEEINYYQNFTYEWAAPEGESLSFKKGSNEISLTNYWDPSSISNDARVMVIINDEEFYGDFNSKFYGLNHTPGAPDPLPYMISGLGNFSARDEKETETQTFFIDVSKDFGINKTYVESSKIKIYLSKPVEIRSITIKIVYDYN